MNNGTASAANTLVRHLMRTPPPSPEVGTAAVTLAAAAYKKLGAGVLSPQVEEWAAQAPEVGDDLALTVPALPDENDLLTAARPAQGDAVETWIKATRDRTWYPSETWDALNTLLDDYRLHAVTGTPLNQHACEGRSCEDCPTS